MIMCMIAKIKKHHSLHAQKNKEGYCEERRIVLECADCGETDDHDSPFLDFTAFNTTKIQN